MQSSVRKMGRGVAALIAASPVGAALVRRGALAPAAWKTPLVSRALSAIAKCRPQSGEVETNLGIEGSLKFLAPAGKHHLVYGRPQHIRAEAATLDLARLLARQSQAFIDVGANEGLFAFYVASDTPPQRYAAIHLFEPDIDLFTRIAANLSRNGVAAHANNMAVSDRTGRQTFYRNMADDLSGSLSDYFTTTHETQAVEMETTSLSDYLEAHDLCRVCVKIDVEGAGAAAWSGAKRASERIDWLIMEIIGPEYEARLARRIIDDTGWSAYYIRDYDLVCSPDGEFEYRAPFYNWLFSPRGREDLAALLKDTRFRIVEPGRRAGLA